MKNDYLFKTVIGFIKEYNNKLREFQADNNLGAYARGGTRSMLGHIGGQDSLQGFSNTQNAINEEGRSVHAQSEQKGSKTPTPLPKNRLH